MTCSMMKMNKSTAFVLFAFVLMLHWSNAIPPADWKSYLNNMTPYRVHANNDASSPKFEGCRPTHFWGMFRHGTRNPNEKFFRLGKEVLLPLRDTIVANQKDGRLSPSEISHMKNWELGLEDKDVLMLTEEGARELKELGERFKSRFPELFAKEYDENTFEFYHTTAVRTKDSASNFTVGLFGEESQSRIKFADQAKSDSILKFYKKCERYIEKVKNSKSIKADKELLLKEKKVKTMAVAVSKRLGMSTTLDIDAIMLMYTWCAFNTAWSDANLSPWCSAFSKNDFEVLEYIKDMKHYAKHGYFVEITRKMMCPMIKNVFDVFNSGSTKSSVKIHFAHSNTMLKFYAILGLFKDPRHLKASNFASNLNRQWKGRIIDSFAANIVFVLYDCGGKKEVLTLHNEKPITLPGCPKTSALCPLTTILATYSDPINNCDFNAICRYQKKQRPYLWNYLPGNCFAGGRT